MGELWQADQERQQLRQNFAEVEKGKRTDEIAAERAGFGTWMKAGGQWWRLMPRRLG
jgi:hypothetical protein